MLPTGAVMSNINTKINSMKEEKGEQKERDWNGDPTLSHLTFNMCFFFLLW